MAKFIYPYRGPAAPMPDLTPEQGAERMAAFAAWMEKVGAALVDVGSPFGSSASVRDDGTEGAAGDLIGYTIVEADDLAAAKAFTDGLPFLSDSDGKFAVEIFELLPMGQEQSAAAYDGGGGGPLATSRAAPGSTPAGMTSWPGRRTARTRSAPCSWSSAGPCRGRRSPSRWSR